MRSLRSIDNVVSFEWLSRSPGEIAYRSWRSLDESIRKEQNARKSRQLTNIRSIVVLLGFSGIDYSRHFGCVWASN